MSHQSLEKIGYQQCYTHDYRKWMKVLNPFKVEYLKVTESRVLIFGKLTTQYYST